MGPLSVLVVDDDPDYRRLARGYIEALGHQVLLAGDGRQAVEVYNREHPDAVLMDILMPVMDGTEAAAAILSKDTAAQVLFVSALDGFPSGTPAEIAQALEIRHKPENPAQMADILRHVEPRSASNRSAHSH